MLGDRFPLERFAIKIAALQEGTIVLDLVPVEAKEGMLGFEAPDLQDAIHLGVEARLTVNKLKI